MLAYQELTAKVYAARASADVISGDFEQVEARMQQMEAVGLEIDEDALTVLLLAYGYAKPQQTLLAEQMFKQQMLRGKVRATREVLEALRLAVGGARCLQLRRELQIGSCLSAKACGHQGRLDRSASDPKLPQPQHGCGRRQARQGGDLVHVAFMTESAPELAGRSLIRNVKGPVREGDTTGTFGN
eukprot:s1846_g2.t1